MKYGTMNNGVTLLGTSLSLEQGQRVELIEATNLPQGGWFARPADGKWEDGIDHNPDDSILLDDLDVSIEED